MKAIIVDDEKDSREILASYLKKYCPEVTVCGLAQSVDTGLEAIKKYSPEIVFLDIEMPYGNGFDLLDRVDDIQFEIIFVTAFDTYAIQALNQSASYYLLKPVNIDDLIKAVDKIKKEKEHSGYIQHAKLLLENIRVNDKQKEKIMLPTMEGFEIVNISDILYCEAVDNFTRFHFEQGSPLLICRTLKHFEDVLREHQFIRIHRSYLINPQHVIRYSKGKGGYVTMKNNKELEVSSNKKKDFLEWFDKQ